MHMRSSSTSWPRTGANCGNTRRRCIATPTGFTNNVKSSTRHTTVTHFTRDHPERDWAGRTERREAQGEARMFLPSNVARYPDCVQRCGASGRPQRRPISARHASVRVTEGTVAGAIRRSNRRQDGEMVRQPQLPPCGPLSL